MGRKGRSAMVTCCFHGHTGARNSLEPLANASRSIKQSRLSPNTPQIPTSHDGVQARNPGTATAAMCFPTHSHTLPTTHTPSGRRKPHPDYTTSYSLKFFKRPGTSGTYLATSELVLDVGVGDHDDEAGVRQGHGVGFLAAAVQQHRVTFGVPFVRPSVGPKLRCALDAGGKTTRKSDRVQSSAGTSARDGNTRRESVRPGRGGDQGEPERGQVAWKLMRQKKRKSYVLLN